MINVAWLARLAAVGLLFSPAQAEDAIVIPAGQVKLAASFIAPEGKGPFPAVVIIAGSGPQKRNAFQELTAALNARGVSVLSYDKRGCGQSMGDLSTATLGELTDDAAAVTAYLKTRVDVDQKRVGLIGMSQGGLFAPAIAAKNPDVGLIVLLGASALRLDKLSLLQWETDARAHGMDEHLIAMAQQAFPKLIEAVSTAGSEEEALSRAKAILAPLVANKVIPRAQADGYAAQISAHTGRDTLTYDPVPVLKQVKVPVLVLTGSLDQQVPAKENLPLFRKALAGNSDATVTELPGLNHIFQLAKTGSAEEWSQLNQPAYGNPAALRIITDWVAKRFR